MLNPPQKPPSVSRDRGPVTFRWSFGVRRRGNRGRRGCRPGSRGPTTLPTLPGMPDTGSKFYDGKSIGRPDIVRINYGYPKRMFLTLLMLRSMTATVTAISAIAGMQLGRGKMERCTYLDKWMGMNGNEVTDSLNLARNVNYCAVSLRSERMCSSIGVRTLSVVPLPEFGAEGFAHPPLSRCCLSPRLNWCLLGQRVHGQPFDESWLRLSPVCSRFETRPGWPDSKPMAICAASGVIPPMA